MDNNEKFLYIPSVSQFDTAGYQFQAKNPNTILVSILSNLYSPQPLKTSHNFSHFKDKSHKAENGLSLWRRGARYIDLLINFISQGDMVKRRMLYATLQEGSDNNEIHSGIQPF